MENKEMIITATEASRSFSEVINRVAYSGESFVIKKGNRIMARITPVTVESEAAQEVAAEAPLKSLPPELLVDFSQNQTIDDSDYYAAMLEEMNKQPA